ncbi:MAG: UDP-N-acetylmuramoyl-tripeptide--D-alanyl-D-alanine ligase [Leptospiraceae bacterium]|nr:UDP-N-acetylmuramoyl-tripeptide--D-alanyl-D-alanine ligase [Leptospiraceae bacterium]
MKEKFHYRPSTIKQFFGVRRNLADSEELLSSITTSSQEVEKNSLFIPLIGDRDGHDYIPDAIKRGVSLFLCKKNHPILKKLAPSDLQKAIFVNDTLSGLGELGKFHRAHLDPFLIGITGSSGKTTTKEFFKLGVSYLNSIATEKNYNNEIGVPFTIFSIKEENQVAVVEMGMNHSKEISRLTKIAMPSIAAITNVGPCHIENLGSLKNIALAKSEIIEGLSPSSAIFLPEDIHYKELFQKKANEYSVKIKYFSLKKSKLIRVLSKDREGFELLLNGRKVRWNLPGDKLLENLTCVLELLSFSGFDLNQSIERILEYKPSYNRNVILRGTFTILDDCYNANPDSMKSSLEIVKQVASGNRVIAILGDMLELGKFSKRYHEEVGAYADELKIDSIICFGKDSKFFAKGFDKNSRKGLSCFEDTNSSLKDLEVYLKNFCMEGDFVLVKGSRGMRMERIVEILKQIAGTK